ncbi:MULTISPECIES: hypothetical protein [Kamptonema]|uniref:hypothetical protein n=1 Tax=Kamptonema TaxID=1501433 RepID=UPI0001DAD560|nr:MULTISPECIES: hypothetical protein [Kamptonema]CBN53560.1 hypothetical protein OSCI_10027 [Kamptonema sp. PCC 6506]
MKSIVISTSISITGNDIIYVAQQVKRDLKSLSKAYPNLLSSDEADDLEDNFMTLLINNAVSDIGFSIYDPTNSNLVYHEYRYKVLLGGDVTSVTNGGRQGTGGKPVEAVWIPSSAVFTSWVIWSDTMSNLSKEQQRSIVSNTRWSIPGENSSFQRRYEGENWSSLGLYASGNLGVEVQVWKFKKA